MVSRSTQATYVSSSASQIPSHVGAESTGSSSDYGELAFKGEGPFGSHYLVSIWLTGYGKVCCRCICCGGEGETTSDRKPRGHYPLL